MKKQFLKKIPTPWRRRRQAQGELEEDALAQAQEEPEKDTRSILLHIPFVCAVMILLLAGFIIWGKIQESKEM